MNPTAILKNEHRVIEMVLHCLEKITAEAIENKRLEKNPAEDAIEFFKMFADHCHHGKEEVHLFPMMEAKGFPRESGPTGVMMMEHEQGRSHIKAMKEAVEPAADGDQEALQKFAQNAHSYIHMLREHIEKEDHCLFTMADQAFSEEDQKNLQAKFDHVEQEEMGEHTHEKYLTKAFELAERYQVPKEKVEAEAVKTCCHHG